MTTLEIEKDDCGNRLDKVLAKKFPDTPRTIWQSLISSGKVLVNGHSVKPKYLILEKDEIKYEKIILDVLPKITTKDLEIIYEDKNVIVVNKPYNLVTHPAHQNTADSVAQRIIFYNPKIKSVVYDPKNKISLMRPGIVHRLDKDTSGVMIVAKNIPAMKFLANQIQNHKMQKKYLALVYGWLEQDEIKVHNWLNRDKQDRRKMAIVSPENGREAITEIKIVSLLHTQKGDKATLIEASPITGRTHQIRVHCNFLGHPILGDQTYIFKEALDLSKRLGLKRQFLHANQIQIRLPNKSAKSVFTAPLPIDLENVLKKFSHLND